MRAVLTEQFVRSYIAAPPEIQKTFGKQHPAPEMTQLRLCHEISRGASRTVRSPQPAHPGQDAT